MNPSLPAVLALSSLLTAGSACAGVLIESATVDTRDGSSRPGQKLYVQDGAARIEQPSEGPDAEYMIFKDDVLYVVEPGKKSYVALDRETIEAVGGVVDDAMSRMREELGKLPPEQRAMVEQMMGSKAGTMLGSGNAPRPITASDTGRSDEAAGRQCRIWELARDGEVFQELCVVDLSEVPGDEDIRALARRMNSVMQELSETLSKLGVNPRDFEAMRDIDGYPVRVREVLNGEPAAKQTVLTDWREAILPAALFAIPEGYERRDLRAEFRRSTNPSE